MMQVIKDVFCEEPARGKTPAPAAPVEPPPPAPPIEAAPRTDFSAAAAGLLEAGLRFLGALSAPNTPLVRNDPETNRPMLAVPLPEGFNAERLLRALGGLLQRVTATGSRA